jgi:hypothetical protein
VASAELVNAPPVYAKALSDLRCADEVVDIHLPTHDLTVIRWCDRERLTTFVVTPTLSVTTSVVR